MPDDLTEFLDDLDDLSGLSESCFLCGQSASEGQLTQEHIVPLWAQRRYELLNQQLTILNQTEIPYRQLTVPCCEKCNTERLKPIEDAISSTVDAGKAAVDALGSQIPFIWLGKMIYGLLYKQMMLLVDRANPKAGTIVGEEFLREFRSHRFFLQQAGGVVTPVGFSPGTIAVFEMQPLPLRSLEWDFRDCVQTVFVGCRAGRVGLIGVLADGGAQQNMLENYRDLAGLKLHPIQFREICAQFCYRSLLFNRTPKYLTFLGSPHQTFQSPLGGFLRKPLFDNWIQEDYASVLSQFTGLPKEDLFDPPDAVWTSLYDPDGNPNEMRYEDFPW